MSESQRAALENRNYYNDPRTIAAMVAPAYKVLESGPRKIIIELDECLLDSCIDDELLPEGHNGIIECRSKTEVCSLCNGSGKTVDPKYDAGGLTQEDIDHDPDWFYDSYMAGECDITCPSCNGLRVVFEAIIEDKALHKAIQDWVDESYEDARVAAMERAMGC